LPIKEISMKIIMTAILALLLATTAYAADGDRWCVWDDPTCDTCRIEKDGRVKIGQHFVSIDEANLNTNYNAFKTTITEPVFDPTTEIQDAKICTKNGNELEVTWTTRAYTPVELNENACNLSEFDQWILKFMVTQGTYQVGDYPQAIQDAYNACEAL
jgi:opacity protein-like surface antigen